MKKLSAAQQKDKERIVAKLRSTHDDMTTAIVDLNEAIEEKWTDVDKTVSNYNAAVEEANEFLSSVIESMDDYQGERSEKWLESEAASSFEDWKSQWEDPQPLEDVDVEEPSPLDEPEPDALDALENLPDSVDG